MINYEGSCECPINYEFDEFSKECVKIELFNECEEKKYFDKEEK